MHVPARMAVIPLLARNLQNGNYGRETYSRVQARDWAIHSSSMTKEKIRSHVMGNLQIDTTSFTCNTGNVWVRVLRYAVEDSEGPFLEL